MKKAAILMILIALTAVYGFSQSDLQTVAIVNLIRTEPITVKQLRSEVEIVENATKVKLNASQRKEVLDGMINERLVVQAAERDKILVSDNEINQHLQQLRSMLAQNIGRQPNDAEFAKFIKDNFNMELQAYRDQARRKLIVEKYLMTKKGDMLNSVKTPTEQEIQVEYSVRRSELLRPEMVRFYVIHIPYGSDAASRTKSRELANNLIKEIGSDPSKFDAVSFRSGAPNSGYQAGDAGYLPRNQEARGRVGDKFIDTAFSLKQGQVSPLIEGIDGFQIIKVTENYSEKILELYDPVQPGARGTVRDYIGQELLNKRQQEAYLNASQELVNELRAGRDFKIQNNLLNW
jgi:parvulin-like peptidyl-prolyl isomerase